MIKGKEHHWCPKCGCKGKWTTSHKHEEHHGQGNPHSCQQAEANVLVQEPQAWLADMSTGLDVWSLILPYLLLFVTSVLGSLSIKYGAVYLSKMWYLVSALQAIKILVITNPWMIPSALMWLLSCDAVMYLGFCKPPDPKPLYNRQEC